MTPTSKKTTSDSSSSQKKASSSAKKATTKKTTSTKKPTTSHKASSSSAKKTTTTHKKADKPNTHHNATHHKAKKDEGPKFDPKYIFLVLGILALVVGAALLLATMQSDDTVEEGSSVTQGEVLASVNGVEITDEEVAEIEQILQTQGQQITREEALEQAVVLEVLSQEVEAAGYSLSTEEAEAEIEAMLAQQGLNLDEFRGQLESQGLSYEQQVEGFREQREIENYLEDALMDQIPEISEEDARAFYDNFAAQSGEDVPSFEEMESEIVMQLQQQEINMLRDQYIESLMAEANIEYY